MSDLSFDDVASLAKAAGVELTRTTWWKLPIA